MKMKTDIMEEISDIMMKICDKCITPPIQYVTLCVCESWEERMAWLR